MALHRAAYLLYTHRSMLDRSGVLVIGPSSAFLHYIDQVLPRLGETGVVSRTIAGPDPRIQRHRTDTPRAAQLKGEQRMAKAIANAVAARERVPRTLPVVRINGFAVAMKPSDVEQAIADARRTRQPHNKARETFVRSMLEALRARYVEQLDYTPEQPELTDVMQQLRMNDTVRHTLNLAWLPMTGPWLIDQLFSKPAQLRRFAPWLSDDDIAALARDKGAALTQSDIPAPGRGHGSCWVPDPRAAARKAAADAQRAEEEQYARDTLAQAGIGSGIVTSQMLVDQINGMGCGAHRTARRGRPRMDVRAHRVDEAQELTAMDWRMLIRRCPSRSFTIVGDGGADLGAGRHTRLAAHDGPLFGEDNWDLNELTINYRNPQEVSDLASRFARSEGLYISTVNAVRTMPDSVERLAVPTETDLHAAVAQQVVALADRFVSSDGTGRVAVIVPQTRLADFRGTVRTALQEAFSEQEFARLDAQSAWDEQVCVCTTQDVKGLEYDAVMVVQPAAIDQEAPLAPDRGGRPVCGDDPTDPAVCLYCGQTRTNPNCRYSMGLCLKHCYWRISSVRGRVPAQAWVRCRHAQGAH